MEAKDTVMGTKRIIELIKPHQLDFPPAVKAEHLILVREQAEITWDIAFKAGIKKGKGEIIEDGNKLLTKYPKAAAFWQLLATQNIYGKTS